MMKAPDSNPALDDEDDLAVEYIFDYSNATPNRFASQDSRSRMTVMVLDEDIPQVFPTSEHSIKL